METPASAETIRTPDPLRPYVAMSNRHRWGICALSAVLPQVRKPSSPSAAEGTEAHKMAEWAVHQAFKASGGGSQPAITPPQGLRDFDYSAAGVQNWRDLVAQYAGAYANNALTLFQSESCRGHHTFAMTELEINDVTIHGVRVFTVADLVAWNKGAGRLVVGDYKFGSSPVGVGTVAEPNPQCAGAAVLWADSQPGQEVREIGLFVYQPRIRHGDQWQVLAPMGVDWLNEQRAQLHAELEAVAVAAQELAAGRQVPGVPGDHCKYCPSARWCNAAAGYAAKALEVDQNKVAVVDLTAEEVMAIWGARSAFKQFEDDLRERVRILHEQAHPAVATKRRAGNRVWAHPAAVVEQLMVAERYDMLQPPGIDAVTQSGAIPAEVLAPLMKRAPDVITYSPAAGKDNALAAGAFSKYLPTQKD